KLRQTARLRERGDANDCIVAPIVAFAPGPRSHAACDERAIDTSGKLLQAREQARAPNEERNGLEDAESRLRLHASDELDHRFRGHQAVRVQDDHVVVTTAPALHELLDVAGLAPGVVPA